MIRKLINNCKQPTPPKWRMGGNFALVAIPILEAQLNTIPTVNEWVKWSITTALILFKLWTNTRISK